MASWLQKKRKGDLVDLAEIVGMDGAALDMRKDDLIIALEQHLHSHASKLQKVPELKDYWNRIVSPVKKEAEAFATAYNESPAKSVRSRGGRRATSDVEPETSPDPPRSILKKTPRAIQKAAATLEQTFEQSFRNLPDLPLPTSPSEVADLVEHHATVIADEAQRYWYDMGITPILENAREDLSTVAGVQLMTMALEAYYLQRVTLPWKFAFRLPAIAPFTYDKTAVALPDLFALLSMSYWAPTLLWVFTSLALPSIVAWFFNFTINKKNRHGKGHGYEIDPFVFNIVKMLVSYLVYHPLGLRFGVLSTSTVAAVQMAMPGGTTGMVISSAVGAAAALYEAVLRR